MGCVDIFVTLLTFLFLPKSQSSNRTVLSLPAPYMLAFPRVTYEPYTFTLGIFFHVDGVQSGHHFFVCEGDSTALDLHSFPPKPDLWIVPCECPTRV